MKSAKRITSLIIAIMITLMPVASFAEDAMASGVNNSTEITNSSEANDEKASVKEDSKQVKAKSDVKTDTSENKADSSKAETSEQSNNNKNEGSSDSQNVNKESSSDPKNDSSEVSEKVDATSDEEASQTDDSQNKDSDKNQTDEESDEDKTYNVTLKEQTKKYKISVAYDETSGIPENAKLIVKELTKDDEEYSGYVDDTADKLKKKVDDFEFIHVFDIYLEDEEGNHIQPNDKVDVDINLLKEDYDEESDINIVHFKEQLDKTEKPEILESEVKDETIKFKTDGFSVYVITDMADPVSPGENIATDFDKFVDPEITTGFRLSLYRNNAERYFKNTFNGSSCLEETTDKETAARWFFEKIEGTTNQFKVYTMDNGAKKYIRNPSGNTLSLVTNVNDASIFEITSAGNNRYYFKVLNKNEWLQYSNGGKGIRFWTDVNNAANSQIQVSYVTRITEDPYDLGGKSFMISSYVSGSKGYGMLPEVYRTNNSTVDRLRIQDLLVRHDPMNQNQILEIDRAGDMPFWDFEWVSDDIYHITYNGQYLRVANGSLSLVDTPDIYCDLRVLPGTGNNKGKFRIYNEASNRYIFQNNSLAKGFTSESSSFASGNSWLSISDESIYSDDDFVQYSAEKVSVSDTLNVTNDSEVVVYTRRWNDEEKHYEFYAIDHNGDLIQCYESGDSICWIGADTNTLLWKFTEYYKPGTTESNGYFELQNTYSEKFIAPSLANNQTIADNKMGINLNGRSDGEYYTTILAWDDTHYDYAGLKYENGKLVACPMSQADTFYFAVMHKTEPGELTEVDTVDHEALGLTVKMINFDSNAQQNAVLGSGQTGDFTHLTPGLLNPSLSGGDDGYPTAARTGTSLATLFAGATPVNHLFIQSSYNSSGYYQFDSTENFAHLDGSNFKVYQELGGGSGTSNTRKHGQFLPYNSINPNQPHPDNPKNLTDIYGNDLNDNNPRKYETLYALNEPDDFYFGLEATGTFMQTPSGKDAWGNDIIFEFVGDDDFWLYVDGELVLDIGGIHKAFGGSVNYSTGDVVVDNNHTTLYDIFKTNYAAKHGLSEDDPQVTAYLEEKFEPKVIGGQTKYIFRDYSAHTVRIFYMERGAGASNLRMRFNLTTVNENEVLLKKEIKGTDKNDFLSIQFPFQIYYDTGDGQGYRRLTQDLIGGVGSKWRVVYQNTHTRVPFDNLKTIDDVDYEDVFYLKPGQTAAISMPEDTVSYYVRECGVDTSIYNDVEVNGHAVQGVAPPGSTKTKYFDSSATSVSDRARITFGNSVDPSALRTFTITKVLYDETGQRITAEDDPAGFTMRISLGDDLNYYNQGEYYVKDIHGNYCYYDSTTSEFKSIGVTNFDNLTPEQLNKVTFTTSPSGAASKLPADHSIEIRGLLVGTRFKVVENDYDIPVGYGKRVWTETEGGITKVYDGYKRVSGSYIVQEGDTENSGVIRDNSNPHIEVHNQRGYGIRAEKEWSDADFMLSHDYVYFAVYVNGSLLPGTVRRIDSYNYTTYFFQQLQAGTSFSDYEVKEVILENPIVLPDGTVTYTSITPLDRNDQIVLDGKNAHGQDEEGLTYTVSYRKGSGSNSRTDVVRNTRLGGLTIQKEDMSGNGIEGARFELKEGQNLVGVFDSESDGHVTTAYLEDGVYTLTEAKSPSGYQRLSDPITITVSNGNINVSGSGGGYTYDSASKTLKIKNKPFSLVVDKIDQETHQSLSGAHFALYRQITTSSGGIRKDYYPMHGYEDIVSGSNGVLSEIDEHFKPGTYYLTETQAPDDYELPPQVKDVLFTISADGVVTVASGSSYTGTLVKTETQSQTDYVLHITNTKSEVVQLPVKFELVDEQGRHLYDIGSMYFEGTYDNSIFGNYDRELWTSTSSGLLHSTINLYPGSFTLDEHETPTGYESISDTIPIRIQESGVTSTSSHVNIVKEGNVYVVKVIYQKLPDVSPTGYDGKIGYLIWIIFSVLFALELGYIINKRRDNLQN